MDADLDNEPGVPMTLDIVALPAPEPSEEESEFECVGSESSEMDSARVEVHLRVSDPPFEVVFEERVVFLRPALAVLEAYFAPELARELGLLAVPHEAAPQPTGPPFASRPSNLMMFFDADGVRGEIMSGSGCGRLRFPAGRRCHVMDRALELDADARAALEGFADLRELPLRGEDGSMTTLSVELLREPLGLCANQLPGQRPEQDEFASRFRSLDDLRVRLRSGDRRINLALPATLSSIPDPHGGGSWTLHVGGYLPPASLSEPDVLDFEVGDGELAHVVAYIRRSMDGEVSAGPLQIGKIAREAGAPAVTGTIDGTVGGKEPTCFGTPTQIAVAFTPQ